MLGAGVLALLVACGGGGQGSTVSSAAETSPRPNPPLSVVESWSSDQVQDESSADFYPMHPGDQWVFDYTDALSGQSVPNGASRRIATAPDAQGWQTIVKRLPGRADLLLTYRASPHGMVGKEPFGAPIGEGATDLISEILEYPTRQIPGGERRLEMRGSLGRDVDGDGLVDGLEARFVQHSDGVQEKSYMGRKFRVLRLRGEMVFTLVPSRSDRVGVPMRTVEWTEWAAGVGQIRYAREDYDGDGTLIQKYLMDLRLAKVAGQVVYGAPTDLARTKVIPLQHNALVVDDSRHRYLATVPRQAGNWAGWVVSIDPATGATVPVFDTRGDPDPLVLAPDLQSMYVGLTDTHEVVQFSLDGRVLRRATLPTVVWAGPEPLKAVHLVVSPIDPEVLVVGTGQIGLGDELVLLRGMKVVPRLPDAFYYRSGMPVFASDGSVVTAPGHQEFQRFEIQPSGVVRTQHPWIEAAREPMNRQGAQIYAGTALLDERSLSVQHVFTDARYCRPWPGTTLAVCLNGGPGPNGYVGLSVRWEDLAARQELVAVTVLPSSVIEGSDLHRSPRFTPGLDAQTVFSLYGRDSAVGPGYASVALIQSSGLDQRLGIAR